MRNVDFSSWQGLTMTLLSLAIFALIGVGIRLILMMTIQQRRERVNRQINERLKALIAAYKTLGGSFTGDLVVDPRHLRDITQTQETIDNSEVRSEEGEKLLSERSRRIRDAVEAALADILLFGTEGHIRLAERVARSLASGEPVYTSELVASLRNFIRQSLDLKPIPSDLQIPIQGPTRPTRNSRNNKEVSRGKSGGTKEGTGNTTSGSDIGLGPHTSGNSEPQP